MNVRNKSRLIQLWVNRYGGAEAERLLRVTHRVRGGMAMHRRRVGWSVRGRACAIPAVESYGRTVR